MTILDYNQVKDIIAYYLYGQKKVKLNIPFLKELLRQAVEHKKFINKIDFSEFKNIIIKAIEDRMIEIEKEIIFYLNEQKSEQNSANFNIKIKPSSKEKSLITFEIPLEVNDNDIQKIFTKVAQAIKEIKNENNLC